MDEVGYSGRLRKRKRQLGDGAEESVRSLLELMESCGKLLIFSGSGLSANSGMSMFTTKNGLYERARSKFKIQDGMKLFSYPFYKQRRKDLQAFFAQIYSEAQSSRAAPGHVAIAELHKMGRLQRHYTLNIDGLGAAVGMDTWHHENNPEGITVEMHGNISYVVCPSCHAVEPLTGKVMETMKACQPVICNACKEDEMRFKVMLYDDEEGDCITPEDVFERLEDDLAVADAVIWVGISFEQSASTEYFRKVRHMLASHGRLQEVPQVILNPSDEPYFNVVSTMSNKEDVKVLDVRATSDDALPRIVRHLHQLGGTSPDKAALRAAAAAATAAEAARLKRQIEQEQAQTAAAAAAEEHATPRASGRRNRLTGDSPAEPGTAIPACQGPSTGTVSYAELSAMDSAAAAALSLPAAVQKHFLQQQLQQQLTGAGDVKQETVLDGKTDADAPQAAAEPSSAAPTAAAPGTAPVVSSNQQVPGVQGSLQQLLSQMHAIHALQALTSAQQQPAVAGLMQPPSINVLTAGASSQAAAVNPLLAALASQPLSGPAVLQAASMPATQPAPPAAGMGPLAAAVSLLASSPAASLLLSSLAAVTAASSGAQHLNGGSSGLAVQVPGADAADAPNGAPATVSYSQDAAGVGTSLAPAVNCKQEPHTECAAAPCRTGVCGEPEQGKSDPVASKLPGGAAMTGAPPVKHDSSQDRPTPASNE